MTNWKSNEWKRIRKAWVAAHPPNHQGYWRCYLCGGWVHTSEMELDHVEPRGSSSRAVHNSDKNLYPTHYLCNREKGSKHVKIPESFDFNIGEEY